MYLIKYIKLSGKQQLHTSCPSNGHRTSYRTTITPKYSSHYHFITIYIDIETVNAYHYYRVTHKCIITDMIQNCW